MTCGRTQEFLAKHKIDVASRTTTKERVLTRAEAFKLAREASEIYAMRGKKIVHLDMKKDKPDEETLAKLVLGPTGNLRAPTLRKGKILYIGFDEETYRQHFA